MFDCCHVAALPLCAHLHILFILHISVSLEIDVAMSLN